MVSTLKLYIAVSYNAAPSTLLRSFRGLNFSQKKCRVMRFARKKFDNLPLPVYYLNGAQVEVVTEHLTAGYPVSRLR